MVLILLRWTELGIIILRRYVKSVKSRVRSLCVLCVMYSYPLLFNLFFLKGHCILQSYQCTNVCQTIYRNLVSQVRFGVCRVQDTCEMRFAGSQRWRCKSIFDRWLCVRTIRWEDASNVAHANGPWGPIV